MEYACGNIFLRPNRLDKGQVIEEHMHNFDHTTFFVKGKFRAQRWKRALDKDGKQVYLPPPEGAPVGAKGEELWLQINDTVFHAGQWCLIEKDVKHRFEALEDDSLLCCIYAHRDPQSGEVVQDFNGWMKAYD